MTSGDVSVCLTFDFDAISVWIGPRRSKSPNLIARGEFGEVGANRLVALLAEYRLPSTWFIPGHTIDTYPGVCERVVAGGHEVGYHGYWAENIRSGVVGLEEDDRFTRVFDALHESRVAGDG